MPADSNTQDIEYLSRLRDDDQEAYKHLFYRYFEQLSATGARMTGDHDTGREAAQRVMLKLWESRSQLSNIENVGGYLKRMVINEAMAMSRTEARRLNIRTGLTLEDSTSAQVEDDMDAADLQEAVNKAVDALPDKCREVFKLSRFEELSYKEISQTLDISTKTVENHVGRALRELRISLKRYL